MKARDQKIEAVNLFYIKYLKTSREKEIHGRDKYTFTERNFQQIQKDLEYFEYFMELFIN